MYPQPVQIQKSDQPHPSYMHFDRPCYECLSSYLHKLTPAELQIKHAVVQQELMGDLNASRIMDIFSAVQCKEKVCEILQENTCRALLELNSIFANARNLDDEVGFTSDRDGTAFVIEDEKIAKEFVAYDPGYLYNVSVSLYTNKDFQAFLLDEDWSKESKIKEGTTLFTILQSRPPITDQEFAIACIKKDICALQLIDLTLLSQINFVNFLVTLVLNRESIVLPYKKASDIVYEYWRIPYHDELCITDKECAKKLVSYDPAFLSGVPDNFLCDKDFQAFLLDADWSKESKIEEFTMLFTILQLQPPITDLEFAIACISKDICALQIIDKDLFSNIDFVDFLVTLNMDDKSNLMPRETVLKIISNMINKRKISINNVECAEKLINYDPALAITISVDDVLYAKRFFRFLINFDLNKKSKLFYDYRLSDFIKNRYGFKSKRNIRLKTIAIHVLFLILDFMAKAIEKVSNFLKFLISG